ncbi:MAG: hypothetical protein U5J63_00215 [Fodinibius sp.]|nr:hypothetical protein [Fodinibius sp.]
MFSDQIVRPGSSISKAEALATFEALSEGIMRLVRQGSSAGCCRGKYPLEYTRRLRK